VNITVVDQLSLLVGIRIAAAGERGHVFEIGYRNIPRIRSRAMSSSLNAAEIGTVHSMHGTLSKSGHLLKSVALPDGWAR
jgi:hypothetical protein